MGSNYVGFWATVAFTAPTSDLRSANGTTDNPFSGAAAIKVSNAAGSAGISLRYDTSYAFSLTITRVDASNVSVSASLTDGAGLLVEWPATLTPASPSSFTYDSVGILLGSTVDATQATFTNIEVTTSATPPPSELAITDLNYDLENGMITLTWFSESGKSYAIEGSSDLNTWPGDINSAVPAAADSPTTSFTFE